MRVLVVGSINRDIVMNVKAAPQDGETIHVQSLRHVAGGKGFNQAAACARLGANVSIVGCVGCDADGKAMRQAMQDAKLDLTNVTTSPLLPTGTAYVIVDANGSNRILVHEGANGYVTRKQVTQAFEHECDVVMLQWELPIDIVNVAIEAAYVKKIPVILDPAPARPLNSVTIPRGVTVLTPNEHEAELLTGFSMKTHPEQVFQSLTAIAPIVLVTMGEQGAILCSNGKIKKFNAYPANVVDTTGAGDVFNANFAVLYALNGDLDRAVDEACRSAAKWVSTDRKEDLCQ